MKKLLYLLLLTPIILLTSCSKSGVTPQTIEEVIIGKEWCLDNENKDGFLLAEDGKFYLTEKCQSNTPIGDWIIDGDLIKYQYIDSTQEMTIIWAEVQSYSDSQVKLLNYAESLIRDYILGSADEIYGCTNFTACNYDSTATCDDGSCTGLLGCTDVASANYNATATCDDGSCIGIGDTYQGGIIFWLDGNGGGLISAINEIQYQREIWGCYTWNGPGADGIAIGTGRQNTIDILAGCLSASAAIKCDRYTITSNGITYDDWFLPSINELKEMYIKLHNQGLGNFNNAEFYWSSTKHGDYDAWRFWFLNGTMQHNQRNNEYYVRPVRAF